tara:strand:+ start:1470 stop:1913 length:444 start_codon:yes stop_codon:yes gene_type:complete
MPYKNPEDAKSYNAKYRQKNREQILNQKAEYYQEHKEEILAYRAEHKEEMAKYRQENKEKIAAQEKEYRQTEAGKKTRRIADWKRSGVIHHDFDELYEMYLDTKNCDICDVDLCEGMFGSNKRCLDHDHETGEVRNILCQACNLRRG